MFDAETLLKVLRLNIHGAKYRKLKGNCDGIKNWKMKWKTIKVEVVKEQKYMKYIHTTIEKTNHLTEI